jgi:hypothetical protein
MIRQERSARNKTIRTVTTVLEILTGASCRTLAYSSSLIGTSPVILMRAAKSDASCKSAAVCRMASVAARPGSSAAKFSFGCAWMKRRSSSGVAGRPCISTRQEKLAGRPAKTSASVSAPSVSGRARSLSAICLCSTPAAAKDKALAIPRRLGSGARTWSRGAE